MKRIKKLQACKPDSVSFPKFLSGYSHLYLGWKYFPPQSAPSDAAQILVCALDEAVLNRDVAFRRLITREIMLP